MTTLNFNIGVLGHVDSGKTSLAKALSTVASTACFDKNPQSKQRGITLDLGFSSFTIQSSDTLKQSGYDYVQYTLVDCPGHASLIKTIIGGAQIIDMMMLVIDIVKGVQTQTAECLIIGEICCDKMLIVLNKLDLIEESKRKSAIEKMSKRLLKTLENTKFANCPIVSVAANKSNPIESEKENHETSNSESVISNDVDSSNKESSMINMDLLIETLKNVTFLPKRSENGSFLLAVDHCFGIKGQGTVMTGTVLSGQVKVNDTIEIPIFKIQKKVKSIQIFRKPVDKASQGERCGICLTNFDSKQFERGLICEPNYVKTSYAVLISLQKIKHFKSKIESGSKFHITIGHETTIGKIELFGECSNDAENNKSNAKSNSNEKVFDFDKEYLHVDEYDPTSASDNNSASNQESSDQCSNKPIKITNYYALIDFTNESGGTNSVQESSGVLCVLNSLIIGSKLDTDIHLNQCRIAFHGRVLHLFSNKDFKEPIAAQTGKQVPNVASANAAATLTQNSFHLANLKIYKEKHKEGVVERKHDEYTLIGKNLFKKETNMDLFVGLKVTLSSGEKGFIESSFGQSGKFKVRIPDGLMRTTNEQLEGASKSNKKKQQHQNETNANESSNAPIKIFLNFKKYVYDDKKKLVQ